MLVYFPNIAGLAKAVPLLGNIEADLRWIELERGSLLDLPDSYARKIGKSAYRLSDTHAIPTKRHKNEEHLKIVSIKND